MPLLYKVPTQKLASVLQTGSVNVIGTALQETSSGEMLGNLQPTRELSKSINQYFRNDVIDRPLTVINKSSIENLLNNSIKINFITSVAKIGISLVSTSQIFKEINEINNRLDRICELIQDIEVKRREIERRELVAEIYSDIENIDRFIGKEDFKFQVLNLIFSLERNYSKLIVNFESTLEEARIRPISVEFIKILKEQCVLIKRCQDSIIKAYFNLNELTLVIKFGSKEKDRMLNLFFKINPIDLTRRSSKNNRNIKTLAVFSDHVNQLAKEIKFIIMSLIINMFVSQILMNNRNTGSQYLTEVNKSEENVLLYLPSNPKVIDIFDTVN